MQYKNSNDMIKYCVTSIYIFRLTTKTNIIMVVEFYCSANEIS